MKRRIPDTVSIPFVLNQMQIGKTRYRDINYGTRVIAVQNVDMEKVGRNMTESSGEEVEISQDGKKDAIYKPAPLNCHSGLKVSVIPPTCEQVTGAMFIDSKSPIGLDPAVLSVYFNPILLSLFTFRQCYLIYLLCLQVIRRCSTVWFRGSATLLQ